MGLQTFNLTSPAKQNMSLQDSNLRLGRVAIPHARNATWPVEKKIEAVTTFLALGNLRQVAAVTGVSYGMIKQWRLQPWWKDLEAEIIASRRVLQANKLSKIVDKSLDVIDDRLQNGDFVYNNKTGDVFRKPVGLRDATGAANALMQRQAILEKLNKDEQVAETQADIQTTLKNLAEQFALMNNRSKAGATDAIYAQRQEGLQTGSGAIYVETGSDQEEGGTEQSPSGDGEGGESAQGGWEGCGPSDSPLEGGLEQNLEYEGGSSESESFIRP